MATTHRRQLAAEKRDIRHLQGGESCFESIGLLEKGCEIFGLTAGQFDLLSVIEHCKDQIGPCHVAICTWTASDSDIRSAWKFLETGDLISLRFLVDASFYTRKPEWCQALIDQCGVDSLRATKTHAKFVAMRNEEWSLAIRTSMNLNVNRRNENFEISDDNDLCGYLEKIVDHEFSRPLDFSQKKRDSMDGAFGLRRLEL
jgi:hypothetical protein